MAGGRAPIDVLFIGCRLWGESTAVTSTTTLVAFAAGVITLSVCLAVPEIRRSRRLRGHGAHDAQGALPRL
ncbi:MAG: hypothetical protein Kow0067_11000 [Coriobacteriia bacterium]|jgi:hypothetical protein